MRIVLDASVAAKWVVEEPGHSEALDLLGKDIEPAAPCFVLVERANILWKKVARGELDAAQAQNGLGFIRRGYQELVPDETLVSRALALSVELSHPVYDCIYLACAESHGIELITEDQRFLNKLGSTRFAAMVKRFAGAI